MAADIIGEQSREVRRCADAPRSPRCGELVREALQSKWEGVQSVAIQALGAWGDPDSRALLRETIVRLDERESAFGLRWVAVRALAGCVSEDDADWALDRLFALDGVIAKHEFLEVVIALPPDSARARLLEEARSPNRDDRQAAMKALGNMAFRDRDKLLSMFLDDDDEDIRLGARLLLAAGPREVHGRRRPTRPRTRREGL